MLSARTQAVALAAIVVGPGHELHHLILGDVAGSGVKTYQNLILYVLVISVSLLVPLWLSGYTSGTPQRVSLVVFAVFAVIWGGLFVYVGLGFGVRGLVLWFLGLRVSPIYPWIAVSTAFHFPVGVPLLYYGLSAARAAIMRRK